jgi:hypothetical protein
MYTSYVAYFYPTLSSAAPFISNMLEDAGIEPQKCIAEFAELLTYSMQLIN